jgi:hypothetical protein
MAAPLFRPERLSHAYGTMQFAVSSSLFPVNCAVPQIVLIDRRGLERDHHVAGRWRTDGGSIDGGENLGRMAERLDLDGCQGCALHRRCLERSRTKRVAEHGQAALGCLTCRLVLDHIPVLHQPPVLDAQDIRRDPVHRLAET